MCWQVIAQHLSKLAGRWNANEFLGGIVWPPVSLGIAAIRSFWLIRLLSLIRVICIGEDGPGGARKDVDSRDDSLVMIDRHFCFSVRELLRFRPAREQVSANAMKTQNADLRKADVEGGGSANRMCRPIRGASRRSRGSGPNRAILGVWRGTHCGSSPSR